jgi:FkbM family methyltransferase
MTIVGELMRIIERLTKPEYVLQPARLLRRVFGRSASPGADGLYSLPLPWKLDLQVRQLDDVARAVDVLGVHDLVVTEAIWRLAAPGDTLVDVGANVGYMSLAMIARLGHAGRVFSYEPQPGVFEELSANVAAARERFPRIDVSVRREALSDCVGTARFVVPKGTGSNRGLAHIDPGGTVSVITQRLDDCADELGPAIALMKIDVEGHEPAVLRGASKLLEKGAIRHVVIEEHGRYPTEATTLLEGFGYSIFSLERSFLRVRLGDPARQHRTSWQAPSLLATRHPAAVIAAFRAPGWRALSL